MIDNVTAMEPTSRILHDRSLERRFYLLNASINSLSREKPVRIEKLALSPSRKDISGTVVVLDLAFRK